MTLFETLSEALRPDNDQRLIDEANKLPSCEYWKMAKLIEQATSDKTREILKTRESYLLHMDEYRNGLI